MDRAGIKPRPARQIPIWFGGGSKVAMRRAAKVGDGFTFAGSGRKIIEQVGRIRDEVAANGRDADAFPVELTVAYGLPPEKWDSIAVDARAANVDYLSVNTMSTTSAWAGTPAPNLTSPAEHIEALETFAQRIGTD